MTASNGTPPYRVSLSDEVIGRMKYWGEVAGKLGLLEWYTRALRVIDNKLRHNPIEWGDPLFSYKHLGLRTFHGVHATFLIFYAVHEEKKIVFVRRMIRMIETPLIG